MIINVKHAQNNSFKITYATGIVTHCHLHNREHAEILAWVEEGNTIEDEFTPAEIIENEAQAWAQAEDKLWKAAKAHQEQYISGAADAMAYFGASLSLPKCLAVKAWGHAIWADYYARKVDLPDANFDFLNHGAIPHTVPEITAEVG